MIEKESGLNFTKILILNTAAVLLVLLSITGIFNPIYSVVDILTKNVRADLISFAQNFNDATNTFGNLAEIKKERDGLKQKVTELEAKYAELKEIEKNSKTLEEQLGTTFTRDYQLIATKIVKIDLKEEGIIIVDRGEKDGVKVGDILVLNDFALGEVIKVNPYTSEILLISSPESEVPVVSQAHGVRGILKGQFGGEITVSNILQTDIVEVGENFVTLGINSNYPAGLLVGKIKEISDVQTETKKSVILESSININQISTAFLLKTPE